jgi:hypothetical protein
MPMGTPCCFGASISHASPIRRCGPSAVVLFRIGKLLPRSYPAYDVFLFIYSGSGRPSAFYLFAGLPSCRHWVSCLCFEYAILLTRVRLASPKRVVPQVLSGQLDRFLFRQPLHPHLLLSCTPTGVAVLATIVLLAYCHLRKR